jgi:uncharacterized protein YciI
MTSPTRPCYVVECDFVADALNARAPHRVEHLDRIRALMSDGRLLVAGAFDDMKQAMLVFAVGSEGEARALIEEDVYFTRGVWTGYKVRVLNCVVPARSETRASRDA